MGYAKASAPLGEGAGAVEQREAHDISSRSSGGAFIYLFVYLHGPGLRITGVTQQLTVCEKQ